MLIQPRDERLNSYNSVTNLERAEEIQRTKPVLLRSANRRYETGLSIIILNLNKFELIAPLLKNLVAAKKSAAESGFIIQIIVGDTGSRDDEVLRLYGELADQITVEPHMHYQFSACNNHLFDTYVRCNNVLFLNNDIIFEDALHSLRLMVSELDKNSTCGIIGSCLFYPDGSVQHWGVELFYRGPFRGLSYHPFHRSNLSGSHKGMTWDFPAVTGACLMIRSELFRQIGGFDEGYQTECQDIALCLQAKRLGYAIKLIHTGNIIHLENATRPKGSEDWQDRQRFVRKWGTFIEAVLP